MSLISEDFLISQEQESKKSSSVEDSLTAKLNNILPSSENIIVQNTDFFKASSSEMTEMEEVGNLPPTIDYSVPKLDFEDKNRISNFYIEYKSSESYTSLGTVVRHETPKIGQRKIRVVRDSRPISAKNRSNSLRPTDNNSEKELVTCLKNIVKRHPDFSTLVKFEKNDLEKYFYAKVREFRKLLEDNIGNVIPIQPINPTKESLRLKNKQKEKKREEIKSKIQEDELERLRLSNLKFEENCRTRLKSLVESTLRKYQTIKMVEDERISREIQKKRSTQKQTVMENIKNFYDNKIHMLKDKITERKIFKNLLDNEHKSIFSEAEKCRKTEQKLIHEKNINTLRKQIDDINLESKAEEEQIHKKIIKLYKSSARTMKKV